MTTNPFTSETFRKIWSRHFNNSKPGIVFNFINNISFIKHGKLPLYVNLGNNLTEGINYEIDITQAKDFRGRVFLIKDIPDYYIMNDLIEKGALKLKKVKQYEGYIVQIGKYETFDQYYNSQFQAKRRQDLRRGMKRLDTCFNISYKMYHKKIEKKEFDFIFQKFYELLVKRYTGKQERCGEIENPKLWPYYCDLAFNLINNKSSTLFVVYNEELPIAISFNYLFNDISIGALTVVDSDYLKFYLGHISIYKQLEWSFNNDVKIFDFTEGDFEYKRRWSNSSYGKGHHILYDSSSLKSRIITAFVEQKFNLKRILRDKKILKKYHNIRYRLSNLNNSNKLKNIDFEISITENSPKKENLELINISDDTYMFLRKTIYDFMYKYPQPIGNIQFFKHKQSNALYFGFSELNIFRISKVTV